MGPPQWLRPEGKGIGKGGGNGKKQQPDKELARLRAENAALKKKGIEEPIEIGDEPTTVEEDSSADREKLQKVYDNTLALLGPMDPQTKALKARLDAAKAQRPPLSRLQTARRQMERLARRIDQSKEAINAKEEQVAVLQRDIAELKSKQEELMDELKAARVCAAEAADQAKQEADASLPEQKREAVDARALEWLDGVVAYAAEKGEDLKGPFGCIKELVAKRGAEVAQRCTVARASAPAEAEGSEATAVALDDDVDVEMLEECGVFSSTDDQEEKKRTAEHITKALRQKRLDKAKTKFAQKTIKKSG